MIDRVIPKRLIAKSSHDPKSQNSGPIDLQIPVKSTRFEVWLACITPYLYLYLNLYLYFDI